MTARAVPDADLPFVTVALPTRNRASLLRDCLSSLVAQDYPPDRFEIVVADDGSTDRTAAVVREIQRGTMRPLVRYLHQRAQGANAARNAAIGVAQGDPICFVDDDEEVPAGWLTAVARASVSHPTAACIGGPVRLRFEGRSPRMCGGEPLGESEVDWGPDTREVVDLDGGNMAVRRSAFDEVGLFGDARRLGHNDAELILRLRARHLPVLYVPEAWLWHRRTASALRLRRLMGHRFVSGVGQARTWHATGRPYRLRGQLYGLRDGLRHYVRARCDVGLVQAAHAAGRLVGMAECRLKGLARR